MNSVITPIEDRVLFGLSEEDRKLLDSIELVGQLTETKTDVAMHKLCVMQAIDLVMVPPEQRPTPEEEAAFRDWFQSFGKDERYDNFDDWMITEASPEMQAIVKKLQQPDDRPVCVSNRITDAMIALNDSDHTTNENRQKLKGLIEEIMNTCPVRRKVEQLKTKVRITDSRIMNDQAYLKAERERRDILRPIIMEDKYESGELTFDEAIALIRQAAALYHADVKTV